jgi:hypothetical protein
MAVLASYDVVPARLDRSRGAPTSALPAPPPPLGRPASLGSRPCSGATLRLVDPVPPAEDPRGLGPAREVPDPAEVIGG